GNADEWDDRGIKEGEVPDQSLGTMREEREWTVKHLADEDLDYLRELPEEVTVGLTDDIKIHCFHATPDSPFDVVKPTESDEALNDRLMQNNEPDIDLHGDIQLPALSHIHRN